MKKIIILLMMSLFAIPALAVCPITGGACTATSNLNSPLRERLIPNNLQNMKKPDAFQPKYVKPYDSALINTDTYEATTSNQPLNNYNSNCQFGVCLPGVDPGGNVLE